MSFPTKLGRAKLRRIFRRLGILITAGMTAGNLVGCATILDGTTQEIAVSSNPQGAQCTLSRADGWSSSLTTPAKLTVPKSKYAIEILCAKSGHVSGRATLASDTNKWSLMNAALGLGGGGNHPKGSFAAGLIASGIGWGIDSASGADNKYDASVVVELGQAELLRP